VTREVLQRLQIQVLLRHLCYRPDKSERNYSETNEKAKIQTTFSLKKKNYLYSKDSSSLFLPHFSYRRQRFYR
jgi:hypothetical protein